MSPEKVLDLLAACTAVGLIILTSLSLGGPVRVVLALGFAFFVPGRAIVTNWPGLARWSPAAMPVVLSLAVTTLAAMAALWTRQWHPLALFWAEAGLSLAGLGVAAARRYRDRGPGGLPWTS